MEFRKFSLMNSLLFCLNGSQLELILLESLFGADLVKFSSAIISTFLQVSEALNFTLFFFLGTLVFTNLCLLTLNLFPVMFCNLVIKLFLSCASSHLLLFRIFICDPDLFVHDLNLNPLGGNFFSIFLFVFLDVCEQE